MYVCVQIGTMEMLLATAYNGIAYALFSGQPLTIIGSTGPVLAFTLVLYRTGACVCSLGRRGIHSSGSLS